MSRRTISGVFSNIVSRKIIMRLVLLLILVPLLVSCAAPAAFQIDRLTVDPAEAERGEEVLITAEVTNIGDSEGSYTAELKIDNTTEELKEVMIPAGKTQNLSFSVAKDELKTYKVAVGEFYGQFAVVEPAAFQIDRLTVDPAEAEPGEEVLIAAEVTNIGGSEGNYTAELKIDNVIEEVKEVTMPPGITQSLSFSVAKDELKTYKVAVGEFYGQFAVVEPAAFQISDLKVKPTNITPGREVIITVKVTNIGIIEGSYSAELKIDGIVEEVKKVTTPPGITQRISFSVVKEELKTYKVTLGELSGQFKVVKPADLPSCCQPR